MKHLLFLVFLVVAFCPAHGEDLLELLIPKNEKNKEVSVCGSSAKDPSSKMCQPKTEDKNISLIDQTETEIEEYEELLTAAPPVDTDRRIEIPIEDESRVIQKSSKKRKSKKRAKNKPRFQPEPEPEFPDTAPDIKPGIETETEKIFVKKSSETREIFNAGSVIKTFEYTVKEGDTLETIIQKHFDDHIKVGQKIIVVTKPIEEKTELQPPSVGSASTLPAPTTREYVVQKGDTLNSILRKFFDGNIYGKRRRLQKLLELNPDITEADTIHLGQKIIVPIPVETAELSTEQGTSKITKSGDEISKASSERKLNASFNYRFNYLSATAVAGAVKYKFNTDYDLEGVVEYMKKIWGENFFSARVGFSDYSMPRAVLAPSSVLESSGKTQPLLAVGMRHEFSEENLLGLTLNYRPFYFLSSLKLHYVPAPTLSLIYENHFYRENHSLLGFGLAAEAIASQTYSEFNSENGSVYLVSFLYRQEFSTKDWISTEIIYQDREQGSTFYKMSDKNAGFKFTYTLKL